MVVVIIVYSYGREKEEAFEHRLKGFKCCVTCNNKMQDCLHYAPRNLLVF